MDPSLETRTRTTGVARASMYFALTGEVVTSHAVSEMSFRIHMRSRQSSRILGILFFMIYLKAASP